MLITNFKAKDICMKNHPGIHISFDKRICRRYPGRTSCGMYCHHMDFMERQDDCHPCVIQVIKQGWKYAHTNSNKL